MQRQHGWLFPLMVAAAASMVAFGLLGIAAVTGHLPLSKPAQRNGSSSLVTANAQNQGVAAAELKGSLAPAGVGAVDERHPVARN